MSSSSSQPGTPQSMQSVYLSPQSMAISSNLDALLEHDQKTRPPKPPSRGHLRTKTSEPMLRSLPPPPRGPRKTRPGASSVPLSPSTPLIGGGGHSGPSSEVSSPVVASKPEENPYINPVPVFPQVDIRMRRISSLGEAEMNILGLEKGKGKQRSSSAGTEGIDLGIKSPPPPRSPQADGRKVWSEEERGSEAGTGGKPKHALASHLSTSFKGSPVDKLLNRSRNAFGIGTNGHRGESNNCTDVLEGQRSPVASSEKSPTGSATSSTTSTTRPGLSKAIREKVRSRAKLLKPGVKSDTAKSIELGGMEIGDHSFLATRGGHSRMVSNSSSTTGSDSTYDPPSTADGYEKRISIGSTVYTSHSNSAHSHIYHNLPPHPNFSSSSLRPRRQSSVHSTGNSQSFFDFLSPDRPGFEFGEDMVRASDILSDHSNSNSSNTPFGSDHHKPPIPTSPKPYFGNRSSPNLALKNSRRGSPAPGQDASASPNDILPPTTNFLNPTERADLVRKTRKLAQVFGQTPEAAALSGSSFLDIPPETSRSGGGGGTGGSRHHLRGAASVSSERDLGPKLSGAVWPPPEGTQYITASGRRHSSPFNTDHFSFLSESNNEPTARDASQNAVNVDAERKSSRAAAGKWREPNGAGVQSSSASFIDLSEEEVMDDGISAIIDISSSGPTKFVAGRHRAGHPLPSPSYLENFLTPEEQAEEERRRKREKLAKLHRFLGSRVPADLVLGLGDPAASLPPVSVDDNDMEALREDPTRKVWLRRRRSSSVAAFSPTWSDDLDRLKDDLNDQEKAINVRRAVKMEKVFGVAPPQTLYHTRQNPSVSALTTSKQPNTSRIRLSPIESPVSSPVRSAAFPQSKPPKKGSRPGTAESSRHLIPKGQENEGYDDRSPASSDARAHRTSLVYSHYQHSLTTLNDIIDRDDKESLAELHQYLNAHDPDLPLPSFDLNHDRERDRRSSVTSSIKSERRRSLPARTSIISLASEYSLASTASPGTPRPEVTDFQLRRRRAAKLTQFFGVDYRDLIRDVLESIENGLEHERKRGTINPEEAEDLLQKLRAIKTKRDGVF